MGGDILTEDSWGFGWSDNRKEKVWRWRRIEWRTWIHLIVSYFHSTSCCFYFVFHFLFIEFNSPAHSTRITLKPLSNLFNKNNHFFIDMGLGLFFIFDPLFSSLFHSLFTSYHFICFSSSIISTSHHVHLSLFIIHHLSSFNILHLQILHYPSYSFSFFITFSTFSLHFHSVCLVVVHDCYNKHLLFYHLKYINSSLFLYILLRFFIFIIILCFKYEKTSTMLSLSSLLFICSWWSFMVFESIVDDNYSEYYQTFHHVHVVYMYLFNNIMNNRKKEVSFI